ncbi:MAG: ferrochelatase [Alphaproteobacteria bacterium]
MTVRTARTAETVVYGEEYGSAANTVSVGPLPKGHPRVAPRKIGVMVINLGTPDSTGFWDVRRYLDEFLSDPRVVDLPRILWQPILKGIILNTRPQKTRKAYEKIWRKDTDESPLRYFTRVQAERLQERLDPDAAAVRVDYAMRYGNPSIEFVLERLKADGCDRILTFALYPQYSATTSATAYDAVFRAMRAMRWQPAIRTVGAHHDDPIYIDALATQTRAQLAALDFEPEVVMCSFHGLPKVNLERGDPYHCHCQKTGRLLREALGLAPERFVVTFQSRFGTQEWLQPYTDKTLEELGAKGIKKIAVLTPGFVSDCVETLEEIALEARETFMEAGGTHFAALPCLNESDEGMAMIETVARRELSGWLTD